MRRGWLLTLALLTACQATPVPIAKKSAAPAVRPSPTPTPAGLQKPAGEVVELVGTVALEAAYAVKQGGARLAEDRLGLARFGEKGVNLISDQGGGIISDHGGGIISNNGGGVVSNNGGGLIGKVKWGLLDQPAVPAFGRVLPVGGMAVRVVSLATGKPLQLGNDAAGRPVYEILTDAEGAFQVYLPKAEAGTLRVVSAPPGATDERLLTETLARKAHEVKLDEDSVHAAGYVREVLVSRNLQAIDADPEKLGGGGLFFDPAIEAKIVPNQKRFIEALQAAGGPSWSPERKRVVAERMADALLAGIAVEDLQAMAGPEFPYEGPPEPALAGLVASMAVARDRVAAVMQRQVDQGKDPEAYFAAKGYMRAANLHARVPFAIRKPGDFNDVLVRGIFANPEFGDQTVALAVATIIADPDTAITADEAGRLAAAVRGLTLGLFLYCYDDGAKGMAAMLAELAAQTK